MFRKGDKVVAKRDIHAPGFFRGKTIVFAGQLGVVTDAPAFTLGFPAKITVYFPQGEVKVMDDDLVDLSGSRKFAIR